VLTLSDGTVVPDGMYTLHFGVYDAAREDGTKYFEQSLDVQVKDGLYNVILSNQGGRSLATAFEGSPRYMEVEIKAAPAGSGLTPPIKLEPRQQVASVPYALVARNAAVTPSLPEWTTPASLLNNWTRYTDNSGASYSPFGYYKDANSRVYLRGVLTGGAPGSVAFVLPPGYRPQFQLVLPDAASVGGAKSPAMFRVALARATSFAHGIGVEQDVRDLRGRVHGQSRRPSDVLGAATGPPGRRTPSRACR
jgi:hypothetical protein